MNHPDEAPVRAGACAADARGAAWLIAWSLFTAALWFLSSYLVKLELSAPTRLAAAMMPIPAFLFMLWQMVRAGRRLDEMQARIQLEALAATVILSGTLVVLIGQLQKIGYVDHDDLGMAWPVIAFSYVACYLLTWRRYR